MKVSVITVSYNAENTVERTIKSVVNQSYDNIEYIVIDGGSTDGTIEVIEKYRSRIAYMVSEPDMGIYDAMNKGIMNASGDIIGIINADDWYEPNAVQIIVDSIARTNAQLIYGNVRVISRDGGEYISCGATERIWYDMPFPHQGVFIKKEIYEKYGSFNIQYQLAADYELLLRLYRNGVRFYDSGALIANFVLGGKSVNQFVNCVKETRNISLKYADSYQEKEDIYHLIAERYGCALLNMAFQGSSDILLQVLESIFPNITEGFYIFGAGIWGRKVWQLLNDFHISVKGFIDNNINKQEKSYCGIPVYSMDKLRQGKNNIFIAVKNGSEKIRSQINSLNNNDILITSLDDIQKELDIICE